MQEDIFIFERLVGSDKNRHDLFVQDWAVKDASFYSRNDQLNPLISCDLFQTRDAVGYMFMMCM